MIAATRAGRHQLIRELIAQQPVASQSDLAELLAEHDVTVTQATLSRDLVELGAAKARTPDGARYVIAPALDGGLGGGGQAAQARLRHALAEQLISAEANRDLVVLRTPPGAANVVASALDTAGWEDVLGTLAGDDTVLVIAGAATTGEQLVSRFLELAASAESRPESS